MGKIPRRFEKWGILGDFCLFSRDFWKTLSSHTARAPATPQRPRPSLVRTCKFCLTLWIIERFCEFSYYLIISEISTIIHNIRHFGRKCGDSQNRRVLGVTVVCNCACGLMVKSFTRPSEFGTVIVDRGSEHRLAHSHQLDEVKKVRKTSAFNSFCPLTRWGSVLVTRRAALQIFYTS